VYGYDPAACLNHWFKTDPQISDVRAFQVPHSQQEAGCDHGVSFGKYRKFAVGEGALERSATASPTCTAPYYDLLATASRCNGSENKGDGASHRMAVPEFFAERGAICQGHAKTVLLLAPRHGLLGV